MTLTFNKGRMIAAAAFCLLGCAVGIVLLVAVFDFGANGILVGALRGGVIGGTAAAGVFGIVFATHASNADRPVVTIDTRGIEFHRAEVGLVPWSVIERAAIEPMMGSKRLVILMTPPAPKPGFMTKLLYGIVAQKRGGSVRLMIPFGRFAADAAAVQALLDARGAQA